MEEDTNNDQICDMITKDSKAIVLFSGDSDLILNIAVWAILVGFTQNLLYNYIFSTNL